MLSQAKALLGLGARNIYLKGGHFKSDESPDLLLTPEAEHWLESRRINTKNTHGTGCSLSASIAANKASGVSDIDAAVCCQKIHNESHCCRTACRLGMAMGQFITFNNNFFFDAAIRGARPVIFWIGDEKIMKQLILTIFSLLGLFSGTAYANDKMTVLLDWFVNPDHGPLIIAQENILPMLD